MRRLGFNQQCFIWRPRLVVVFLSYSFAAMFAAFMLAWAGRSGTIWFLCTSLVFALWATVVTTSATVRSCDLTAPLKLLWPGQESEKIPPTDDAQSRNHDRIA